MFKLPFSFASEDKLKKRSTFFISKIKHKKISSLKTYLENCDTALTRESYLGICNYLFCNNFIFLFILFAFIFYLLNLDFLKLAFFVSLCFSIFIYLSRLSYPRMLSLKKQREIEKNLIPALQDMVVQLNSGIPLYSIMLNLSDSDYGELSKEFKRIVKRINVGVPQAQVLEEAADKNSSIFFRRALWQISNGLKAGSDISIIVKESIRSLNEEQLIQIQNYGSKLNPLIMFYMLSTVILPALAITFLTILTSMIGISKSIAVLIFGVLLFVVAFIQIMFLGAIKSIRPTLI